MAPDPVVTGQKQAYNYRPLQGSEDIRLLHITPGSRDDGTFCTISHTSFDSAPPYESLSYTWGDGQKTHVVCCEGRHLPITANLHSTLCHLRYLDRDRTVWVDAICINQDDVSERSQQVRIMKLIYAQAHNVIVWLGVEVESDDIAFDFIQNFEEGRVQQSSVNWEDAKAAWGFLLVERRVSQSFQ